MLKPPGPAGKVCPGVHPAGTRPRRRPLTPGAGMLQGNAVVVVGSAPSWAWQERAGCVPAAPSPFAQGCQPRLCCREPPPQALIPMHAGETCQGVQAFHPRCQAGCKALRAPQSFPQIMQACPKGAITMLVGSRSCRDTGGTPPMHPKKPPKELKVTRSTPVGTAGQIPCRGRRFRTCFLGKLRHGAAREGKAGGLEGTGSRRIHPVRFIKALLGPRPGQEHLLAGCRGFWRAFPWPWELRPAAALALSSLRCPAAHLPCTRIATEPSESRPPARWRSLCWQEKKKKKGKTATKITGRAAPVRKAGLEDSLGL